MLILHDRNQTLEPPEGFAIQYVKPEGEYIVIEYRRVNCVHEGGGSYSTVIIYLNSMGREVIRTTNETEWVMPSRKAEVWMAPRPISRWFRIKAGFYLALLGMEEMLKCLNK